MAFDKAKTLHAAEKYLEMGKIPAAAKEYCKIVESDPDDYSTLNILGDLHVRVGNKAEAITCFRRIADHYRAQEFALKAIAMFKKIDRLAPNDLEIAMSLAELYAQQDLIVEARAHYLMIASAHEKAGATQAGLEVLRKIADLDPQNTEVRIKLAQNYLNEGMKKEAAASFAVAANTRAAHGALDEALEMFAKSLDLDPANHPTLEGFLAAHTARGTSDEAAEVIARASQDHPEDADLISLLARAYVEAEDPEKAESATNALIAKEPSAFLRMVEVAGLFVRTDRIEDAVRIIASVAEQMLAERHDADLIEALSDVLNSDADNVPALRLLVHAYSLRRDNDNLKGALERLAEAAQAAGLVEDERHALTQLMKFTPENHQIERLNELGGPEEDLIADVLAEPEATAPAEPEHIASFEEEFALESGEDPAPAQHQFEVPATADDSASEKFDEMEIERGFAFEGGEDDVVPQDASVSEPGADNDRHAAIRKQELESVDFYIEQGYVDIAIDTLNLLESQFGAHPDVDARRKKLNALTGVPEVAKSAPADSHGLILETDSLMPLHDDTSASAMPSKVIDPGLAEVFEEYRASAEDETCSNGDYETHYNLGLAYKEMDLFEEALEEFQAAINLVSPDDGTSRYVQCCNLLGHCFMQNGVPQLAVKWLNQGLDAPNASDEERQALRFELAAAHEQAGDLNRAMDLFTEIYGVNVSYRGVNERLRALQSRMAQ
jgi:tetratricopeptide (TPR) repeat protein